MCSWIMSLLKDKEKPNSCLPYNPDVFLLVEPPPHLIASRKFPTPPSISSFPPALIMLDELSLTAVDTCTIYST